MVPSGRLYGVSARSLRCGELRRYDSCEIRIEYLMSTLARPWLVKRAKGQSARGQAASSVPNIALLIMAEMEA